MCHIESPPLPQEAFDKLEKAVASHRPERSIDPNWGADVLVLRPYAIEVIE